MSPRAGAGDDLKKNKPLPEVTWLTAQGDSVSWASMGGDRPLVTVFWATWCSQCKKETPKLQEVQAAFAQAAKPPVWAWASLGESAAKVQPVAAKRGLEGIILVDPDEVNAKGLGISYVPTVVVTDAAGTVVYGGKPSAKKLTSILKDITISSEPTKESTHD